MWAHFVPEWLPKRFWRRPGVHFGVDLPSFGGKVGATVTCFLHPCAELILNAVLARPWDPKAFPRPSKVRISGMRDLTLGAS